MVRTPILASILFALLMACGGSSNDRTPEAPPAGWKVLSVEQIALALPASYVELSAAERRVQTQEGDQLASNVLLAASDASARTSVNVARLTLPAGNWKTALEDAALRRAGIELLDREEVALGAGDGMKIITRASNGAIIITSMQYYIPSGKDLWSVTYVASNEVFQSNIPVFDQSARTIAITK